jgi:hypothetical protein
VCVFNETLYETPSESDPGHPRIAGNLGVESQLAITAMALIQLEVDFRHRMRNQNAQEK